MKKVNKTSLLNVVFLIGILAMVNVIGIRYFIRADLTSSKMYSLADASKNVVASIEDKLLVKAYFSPNIPGQYGDIERYLRDMLEDYRAYSKGHLEYEFIDPGSAEALEKEAQSFRIPPMQVQAVAKDKMETVLVYMGVVFIYGDKKETIPSITSIANLEYEITSLIYRLTIPDQPILGIASTGTEQQEESMQVLYESLGRMYDVRPVSLDEPIDPAFDGIFVLAPRQPFTEWQLFNLDQYIMGGGKVGMFMNSYRASLQNQQAAPYNLGINEFLNNYGLGLGEDMVIDTQANMVEITSRQGFFNVRQPVRFPFLPIVNNLNRENIITRQLQAVGTIFPSSVDTTYAVEKGYDVDVLMYSSEMSGRRTGPYIFMNPQQPMTRQDFQESRIPLAAIVRGKFTSYFAESGPPKKPVEKAPDAEGDATGDDGGEVFEDYDGPFVKEASSENRLLLVGDGNMVLDRYAQRPNDLLFVQNCADWLLQSEDLISIRSKQIPMRPLTWKGGQVPDSIRNLTKWANRIGPVILVIILGIVLWQMRRVRNKALVAG